MSVPLRAAVLVLAVDTVTKAVLPTEPMLMHYKPAGEVAREALILGVLAVFYRFAPRSRLGLALVLAGGLSNVLWALAGGIPNPLVVRSGDLVNGFNVADVAIVTGCFVLVFAVLFRVFRVFRSKGRFAA